MGRGRVYILMVRLRDIHEKELKNVGKEIDEMIRKRRERLQKKNIRLLRKVNREEFYGRHN